MVRTQRDWKKIVLHELKLKKKRGKYQKVRLSTGHRTNDVC